jgi:hypothetical protein
MRGALTVADDVVVEDRHVDQGRERLETVGDSQRPPDSTSQAAGVLVHENHGRDVGLQE